MFADQQQFERAAAWQTRLVKSIPCPRIYADVTSLEPAIVLVKPPGVGLADHDGICRGAGKFVDHKAKLRGKVEKAKRIRALTADLAHGAAAFVVRYRLRRVCKPRDCSATSRAEQHAPGSSRRSIPWRRLSKSLLHGDDPVLRRLFACIGYL